MYAKISASTVHLHASETVFNRSLVRTGFCAGFEIALEPWIKRHIGMHVLG